MKLFSLNMTMPNDPMEIPLIQELWIYFYQTYLDPSEYYPNLSLGSGTMISVRLVIIGLFLGLAAACFFSVFNKQVIGLPVRALIAKQAHSSETAVTLEALGLENNAFCRFAVSRSLSARRVIKCVEEEEYLSSLCDQRERRAAEIAEGKKLPPVKEIPYKINPYADRFYIPEELKYAAGAKFEQKGSGWLGAVICAAVLLVILVIILLALPYILSLLDSVVGMFSSSTPSNVL